MSTEPYIGEIRIFGFTYAPKGWALCNGQILSIAQNAALFSILGTTYGGNGTSTFALPNLQGRVVRHWGNGPSGTFVLGETAGVPSVTLALNQISHSHPVKAAATANAFSGAGNFPASAPSGQLLYGATSNTSLNATIVSTAGVTGPHNNLQPYLVLEYCIALVGIFPSRN